MRFFCVSCQKEITDDDISIYKKLVNRGAENNYECRNCICQKYKLTDERLDELIHLWRLQGCQLFPPLDD